MGKGMNSPCPFKVKPSYGKVFVVFCSLCLKEKLKSFNKNKVNPPFCLTLSRNA